MTNEQVAMVCHQANKAFCEFLGDNTQVNWCESPNTDGAPDWQKQSAINGVEFHRRFPFAGDSASHDNWMALKEAEGWTYGPVKDIEAKTHPCMVPFDQLPKEQQFKDKLFRTIVHACPVPTPSENFAGDEVAQ